MKGQEPRCRFLARSGVTYGLFLTALLSCGAPPYARAASPEPASEASPECGEPLAKARFRTLNILFLPQTAASSPSAALLPSSRARLEEMRLALGPLSPEEKLITDTVMRLPVPLVHRTQLQRLKSIFASGGLLSPREAGLRGIDLAPYVREHRDKYLSTALKPREAGPSKADLIRDQNLLEGSLDCIFASVGRPAGKEIYGDAVINIKAEMVTPRMLVGLTGALVYLWKDPGAAPGTPPSEDKILAYSQTVYSGVALRELLGLLIVTRLRAAGEKGPAIRAELLKAGDSNSFYAVIEAEKLGHLEAKIPKTVTMEDIESVMVPAKDLSEVLGWEESKPWKEKIKAY